MRKFNELKRIVNNLPYLNIMDQGIIIEDLSILKESLIETREIMNFYDSIELIDTKLKLIKKVTKIITKKTYNEPNNLKAIKTLYAPIFDM